MQAVAARLDARAKAHDRHSGASVLPILLQLGLVLAVVYAYQLETRAFFHVMLLAVAGFAIQSVLPRARRLPFFTALSFLGIFVVFPAADALWIVAAGGMLIGLCHLPVEFRLRIVLILGVGAVLAAARAGALAVPASAAVWPILGSMFMFRLALYLYSLRHDEERPTLARTLAYFFMLPNLVFPLFPVIDYATFGRSHYDRDEREIYATGVQWIVRGIIHLLLYRVVYQFVVVDPADVASLSDLIRSLLGVFLLYLRVSGSFHLIVGMLHLFGFRLPETHHLYYLASSFTDFWRRINIYWKDFMMKLVYYPSFFRLRRWGTERAVVASTVVVFAATWLLHSYQWFWLRGRFPVTVPDVLFWGLLGALVVANSVREVRRGRNRSLGRRRWDLSRALRTVAIFGTICVLWSLWSAESLIEWLWMLRAAANAEPIQLAAMVSALLLGLMVAGVSWDTVLGAHSNPVTRHATFARSVTLLLLLALARPAAFESTAPQLAAAMATLTRSSLNARDTERQVNGYYEDLDRPSRRSRQPWNVAATRPSTWQNLSDTGVVDARGDNIGWELYPSRQVMWNGHRLTTNAWGMRDREYTRAKPDKTIRIAMLGSSHAMGSHVSDDEVFETRVEERLNREIGPTTGLTYEILNFAVGGFMLPQQVALLEDRVFDFDPDIVMFVVSTQGRARVAQKLLRAVRDGNVPAYPAVRTLFDVQGLAAAAAQGWPVPFRPLRSIATRLGLATRMPPEEARLRTREIAKPVELASLVRGAELAHGHGAIPVLVLLDGVSMPDSDISRLLAVAGRQGYTIFNLLDVYEGHEPETLRVARWDNHPNARGHELIAERLYDELMNSLILAAAADPAPDPLSVPEPLQ